VVTVALLGAAFVPYQRWVDGQRHVAALKGEEAQLAGELAQLQEDLLQVLGPEATERLARQRLGMVRGGERAYVLAAPDEPIARPEVIEPASSRHDRAWWSRSGSAVLRVLRALI
jgi:hypothetical protein